MLPAIPLIPEQYAAVTSTPEKSPMRMLSPDGVRLAITVAR